MLRCIIGGFLMVPLAVLASACADGGARQCLDHSECASGLCLADGTCAPSDADAGPDDVDADPDQPDADTSSSCAPNHDGTIARDEILLAAHRTATFRVATDVAVDTAGQLGSGGARSWNMNGPYTGDRDVTTTLLPMEGTWYESSFPGASYATRLSETEELLGVFEITETALLLRGVVSPEAGLARTELTYDPPILVLELPMTTTSSWSTTSTVSGVASGITSIYTESYEQRVDAVGTMDTPYGDFPVQRVQTDLTRTVGAAVITLKSFSFVAECFGIVGTITSQQYESDTEFTDAAEIRRLAP